MRIKNGTIIYIRAVQRQSLYQNRSNPTFYERDAVELEKKRVFHTGRSSNHKSILEKGLWERRRRGGGEGRGEEGGRRGRREGREKIKSEKHKKQACFFSPLNPQDSSSRQRTINWTRPDREPIAALHKQSCRQDHDCFYYFNLRRAQDANLGIS